jgi:hypothetical protein
MPRHRRANGSGREGDGQEVPLLGGLGSSGDVVRVGDTVRKPVPGDGGIVVGLLHHLERVGFEPVPRHLGDDEEGRWVLSWLPGDVDLEWRDHLRAEETLREAGALLRAFHDATATSDLRGDQEVVCHGDYGPWNVVQQGGRLAAIIDLDGAAPGPRVHDLSYALWCWGALGVPGRSVEVQAEQAAAVLVGYLEAGSGWGPPPASVLVEEVVLRQIEVAAEHRAAGRTQRAAACDDDREWVVRHRVTLEERWTLV